MYITNYTLRKYLHQNVLNTPLLGERRESETNVHFEIPLDDLQELKLSFGNVTFSYKNKFKKTETIQPISNTNRREQLLLQPRTDDVKKRKNQRRRTNLNFLSIPAKNRLSDKILSINEVKNSDFGIPYSVRPFSKKNLRKKMLLRRRKANLRKRKMQERNEEKFDFFPIHSKSRTNSKIYSINSIKDPMYTMQESVEPFSNKNYGKKLLLKSRNKALRRQKLKKTFMNPTPSKISYDNSTISVHEVKKSRNKSLRRRKLKKPFNTPTPSEISYDKSTISVNEVNHAELEEQDAYESYDVSYNSNPLSQTMILV